LFGGGQEFSVLFQFSEAGKTGKTRFSKQWFAVQAGSRRATVTLRRIAASASAWGWERRWMIVFILYYFAWYGWWDDACDENLKAALPKYENEAPGEHWEVHNNGMHTDQLSKG